MEEVAPVEDPGPVHEDAAHILAAVGHAARQQLPAAAAHIHDAPGLGPGVRLLQGHAAAGQAELGEVGHCVLEVVRECLMPCLLVVLQAASACCLRTQLEPGNHASTQHHVFHQIIAKYRRQGAYSSSELVHTGSNQLTWCMSNPPWASANATSPCCTASGSIFHASHLGLLIW